MAYRKWTVVPKYGIYLSRLSVDKFFNLRLISEKKHIKVTSTYKLESQKKILPVLDVVNIYLVIVEAYFYSGF